jgi:hypothetical protein
MYSECERTICTIVGELIDHDGEYVCGGCAEESYVTATTITQEITNMLAMITLAGAIIA